MPCQKKQFCYCLMIKLENTCYRTKNVGSFLCHSCMKYEINYLNYLIRMILRKLRITAVAGGQRPTSIGTLFNCTAHWGSIHEHHALFINIRSMFILYITSYTPTRPYHYCCVPDNRDRGSYPFFFAGFIEITHNLILRINVPILWKFESVNRGPTTVYARRIRV